MILKSLLFSSILIVISCTLLPTPDLLTEHNLALGSAYLFFFLCFMAFVLGYSLLALLQPCRKKNRLTSDYLASGDIPTKHLLLLVLVGLIGVLVLIAQIATTVGLSQYLAMLSSADTPNAVNLVRELTVKESYSEGGLPGIIKMFSWNFVIAPFCVLALIARGYKIRGVKNWCLGIAIAILYFAGSTLRMDRLSLLALIPVIISIFQLSKSKKAKLLAIFGTLLLLIVLVIQNARRGGDLGLLGWAALYLNSGMVNLALMIKTNTVFTYGFNGLLTPIGFIFKSVGINLVPSTATFDWLWTPAQDAFGYSFEDFGWFGILSFLLAGIVGRHIDWRASDRSHKAANGPWRELQWAFSYACLSLPVVPAYAGVEFPLLIGMSILIIRSAIRFAHRKQNIAMSNVQI